MLKMERPSLDTGNRVTNHALISGSLGGSIDCDMPADPVPAPFKGSLPTIGNMAKRQPDYEQLESWKKAAANWCAESGIHRVDIEIDYDEVEDEAEVSFTIWAEHPDWFSGDSAKPFHKRLTDLTGMVVRTVVFFEGPPDN